MSNQNKNSRIDSICGVILAGGKSSRFGENKALAEFHGQPLISRVAEIITSVFSSCLLVTNDPDTYKFLNLPMIGDIFPGHGPLAGIHAALTHVPQPEVFVTGCDMPRIDPRFIRYQCRLAEVEKEADAILPWLETGPEPLHGLYRKTCLPVIENSLKNGERKAVAVLEKLKVRRLEPDAILANGGDLKMFANINRPGDLYALFPKL